MGGSGRRRGVAVSEAASAACAPDERAPDQAAQNERPDESARSLSYTSVAVQPDSLRLGATREQAGVQQTAETTMSHHTLAGTSESEAVDPVFREGDQEATYVIVDLDGLEDQLFPAAGDQITLEGLDTDAPQLVLASGRRLKGHYEETVGSCVAFAEDLDPATRQFALQYMCHTHRKLKFTTELPATSAAT